MCQRLQEEKFPKEKLKRKAQNRNNMMISLLIPKYFIPFKMKTERRIPFHNFVFSRRGSELRLIFFRHVRESLAQKLLRCQYFQFAQGTCLSEQIFSSRFVLGWECSAVDNGNEWGPSLLRPVWRTAIRRAKKHSLWAGPTILEFLGQCCFSSANKFKQRATVATPWFSR